MSKKGHINKYFIIKSECYSWSPLIKRKILEVWRLDNKHAHLHRGFNHYTQKMVIPPANKMIKKCQFKHDYLNNESYEITELDTRQELDEALFLEMV